MALSANSDSCREHDPDPSQKIFSDLACDSFHLVPSLRQRFRDAAVEDAYQMSCSYPRACGLTMLSICFLAVVVLRAFFHLTGYLTDENAPLRNTPGVVGSYVILAVTSILLLSIGLNCMQSKKKAMAMTKPLHFCTRAAVIGFSGLMSCVMTLTWLTRNKEDYEWFIMGATLCMLPFHINAMKLSVLECIFPTVLILLSMLASPACNQNFWNVRLLLCVVVILGNLLWILGCAEQSQRGVFIATVVREVKFDATVTYISNGCSTDGDRYRNRQTAEIINHSADSF